MKRPTVYLTTLSRNSVVAMILWGHLRACDLNGHKQGTKREDDEGQRCCHDRLEGCLSTWESNAQKRPSEPRVEAMHKPRSHQLERDSNKGNDPKR